MGIDAVMFAETDEPITEDDVRRWSDEAVKVFGEDALGGWTLDRAGKTVRVPALTLTGAFFGGETAVEAHFSHPIRGRLWEPGYERGDLTFFIALAEWLERTIPGARVLYGCWSTMNGSYPEPWPAEKRAEYRAHHDAMRKERDHA